MTTGRSIKFIGIILLYISLQAPALSNESVSSEESANGVGHRQVNCSACHSFEQSTPISGSASEAGRSETCSTCHSFTGQSGTIVSEIHRSIDSPCQTCHEIHREQADNDESTPTAGTDRGIGFECLACHNSGGSFDELSPGHRIAADLYHKNIAGMRDNTPSGTCLYCHSDQGSLDKKLPKMESAPAIHQVSSHPYGVPANSPGSSSANSPTDERVHLNEEMIECQTCHSLVSGRPFALIPFPSSYDLCLSCHPDKTPPSISAEIRP